MRKKRVNISMAAAGGTSLWCDYPLVEESIMCSPRTNDLTCAASNVQERIGSESTVRNEQQEATKVEIKERSTK